WPARARRPAGAPLAAANPARPESPARAASRRAARPRAEPARGADPRPGRLDLTGVLSETWCPMIPVQTPLAVADNTGAKEVMCFKVLGGSASRYKRRVAGLGDIIIASVKKATPGGDVKAGDVVRCVIVRAKNPTRRTDGSYVRFDRNACVLINNE